MEILKVLATFFSWVILWSILMTVCAVMITPGVALIIFILFIVATWQSLEKLDKGGRW